MKKLFLFLWFVFVALNIFSQTYPQPNAHWTYCYGDPALPVVSTYGAHETYYTRDSVIDGISYNVVEPELYSTDTFFVYLTRYSNDTVYRYVNGQEYLYFHFQLNLGEVFNTYRSYAGWDDTLCSSLLPLEVIDSGTTMFGDEELTYWILEDTLGFDSGFGPIIHEQYTLYEQIGFTSMFRFYNTFEEPGCTYFIEGGGYNTLEGYNDDSFTEVEAICETTGLIEEEISFNIYPNPSIGGELKLEFPYSGNWNVQIHSLSGQLVYESLSNGAFSQLMINARVESGIYLVSVYDRENNLARKLVVR